MLFGTHLLAIWFEAHARNRDVLQDELIALGRAIITEAPGYYPWITALGLLNVDRNLKEAREVLEGFVEPASESIERDSNYPVCLWVLARIAGALGDVPRARTLLNSLTPFNGQHLVVGLCAYWGPISHQLGELQLAIGDPAAAVESFRQALHESEAAHAVGWTAWARFGLARAIAGVMPGSAEVAALLEQALRTARRHSMQRLLHELGEFPTVALCARQA
jgi:hypothetical protein